MMDGKEGRKVYGKTDRERGNELKGGRDLESNTIIHGRKRATVLEHPAQVN